MPWLSTSQDNLFSERSQGCFSFWTLLSCGWTLVKQRPPWPPPVQLEKSLSMMFCCSESECKMKYLQCELNNHCWTHCIELVDTALQSPYMITILLLSGAIRDIRILSCTTIGCPFFPDYILFEVETSKLCCKWHVSGPSQCISRKLQCDDYKKSKHRAYALCIQWKIYTDGVCLL